MKRFFILLTVVFTTQLFASAQNGYVNCYGQFVPSNAPWLQATPQSFVDGLMSSSMQNAWNQVVVPVTPVPASQPSSSSAASTSSSHSSYESRYGDKECSSCHGTGICQTCNGKGWYSGFGGSTVTCPNCHSSQRGRCGRCAGRGTVYGLK